MANCFRRKQIKAESTEKVCNLLRLHEKKCPIEELIVQDIEMLSLVKTDIAAEQAELLESAAIKQIPERTLDQCGIPSYVTATKPGNEFVSVCCFILVGGSCDLSHWLLKQDLGNRLPSHMHKQGPCDYFCLISLGSPRCRCQNGIRSDQSLNHVRLFATP